MLTDTEIENLVLPIIRRQKKFNYDVFSIIGKRVGVIANSKPDDVYKLNQYLNTDSDVRLINSLEMDGLIAVFTAIEAFCYTVAEDAYKSAKSNYFNSNKPFIRFANNQNMQKATEEITSSITNKYRNAMSNVSIRLAVPGVPRVKNNYNLADGYREIVNRSLSALQLDSANFYTQIRDTIRNLVSEGIRFKLNTDDKRSFTQRTETFLHNLLLDGVKSINQKINERIAIETNTNGVEISVHEYPAPDHESIQGHQFTNEQFENLQSGMDFKDIDGNEFEGIERAIGEWNCRHFTTSIIVGMTEPQYSNEELQSIISRNHKGLTLSNGTHLTLYQCNQVQREYKDDLAKLETGVDLAKTIGDAELLSFYNARYTQKLGEYKTFLGMLSKQS